MATTKRLLVAALALFCALYLSAQTDNVGIGTTTPDPSAALDITASDKGLLPPRLTATQRLGISNPAEGLVVYDTNAGVFYFFNGAQWVSLAGGSGGASAAIADSDNDTKVEVEQNPDEDIIRFSLGGTERWIMTGARLENRNSGNSVFIGEGAGASDDGGSNRNVAVGHQALHFNTAGIENTANGYQALYSNTIGIHNTANGEGTLLSNTTGNSNTAMGRWALHFNTNGNNNTAIGISALSSNTTGNNNTAIGFTALSSNVTGEHNTANGFGALPFNTTGNNNLANGFATLYSNTTGNYNTAVGNQALSNNIAGSYNTAIGHVADVTADSLVRATAIGHNAKVGCSNCLVLGGTGIDAVNVGIGTATPASTLEVNGPVTATSFAGDGSALTKINLKDTDGDTKIQVEKFTNEDIIRFDLGGTEKWVMTGSRLESRYSGQSVFIGEGAGASDDLSANQNVAVGYQALFSNINGNNNTANGRAALRSNTIGEYNTANGSSALHSNISGASNTANGSLVLYSNTTGNFNTANGNQALFSNTVGNDNTANGNLALFSNTTGSNNTANGSGALFSNTAGSYNTALGYAADVTADSLVNSTAIGHNAKVGCSNCLVLGSVGIDAVNVGIGTVTPASTLEVIGTVTATSFAGDGSALAKINVRDADGDTRIQVEKSPNEDIIRFDLGGTEKWVMSGSRLVSSNSGGSIFIGEGAGASDDLSYNLNVAVGYQALYANTTGVGNAANGSLALLSNTVGNNNTANGYQALHSNTTGSYNTALGYAADVIFDSLTKATAIGYNAKVGCSNCLVLGGVGIDAVNVGIGTATPASALEVIGSVNATSFAGNGSALTDINVDDADADPTNELITSATLNGNTLEITDSGGTQTVDLSSLVAATDILFDADNDTKVEVEQNPDEDLIRFSLGGTERWVMTGAHLENRNSGNSVFIGEGAGTNDNLTFNRNVAVGYQSLHSNINGFNNTAIGYQALHFDTTGFGNTANGYQTLYSNTAGNNNTANGNSALYANTVGSSNTADGNQALHANTAGSYNTANGNLALYSNTDGASNTANGSLALFSNTTGANNTASGATALNTNTTGSNNTALGAGADVSTGTLTNATALGYAANTNASNKVRIGNTSVTTIEGQVDWSFPSDARFKFNIDDSAVPGLALIDKLRPVTYQFDARKYDAHLMQNVPDSLRQRRLAKADGYARSSARVQTGFLAQEVEQACKELGYSFSGLHAPENETDNYSLAYGSFVPLLVKAVQELAGQVGGQQEIIEQQREQIEQQQGQIRGLETQLGEMDALKQRLARLEAALLQSDRATEKTNE